MKKHRHIFFFLLVTAILMSSIVSFASAEDFDLSKHEIVTELVGQPGEEPLQPMSEPCTCGGRVVTVKTGESGFIKGIYSPCEHGLNGNVWTNQIYYVSQCNSCGQGVPFTREVTEIRCNH